MFTSICPKCGRDLPLSSPECPFCVAPPPAAAAPEQPISPQPNAGQPNAGQPYPPQGYPPQPFPPQGYPPQQYPPQQYPPQGYPPQQYPPQQYPPQAYPPQPYPPQAYPPQPYPPQYPAQQQAPVAPQAVPSQAPPISLATTQTLPTIPIPVQANAPEAPPVEAPAVPMQTYVLDDQPGGKPMPAWLGFLLAFFVIGAIVASLIWYTNSRRENGGDGASRSAAAKKAKTPAGVHPATKYLELTGFRFMEGPKKKPQVEFICVNHGNVDFADLEVEVILRVKGDKPDTEPVGSFKVKIPGVSANGSKEILVRDLNTKLKFFDLPDWQFLDALVTITSPANE